MADEKASTQDEKNETTEEVQEETETEGSEEETTEEVTEEKSEEEVVEEEEEEEQSSRRDTRIQELVETNKQLMDLLKTRAFSPQQPVQREEEQVTFEDPEVEKIFNKKLTAERQRTQQFQGQLAEEIDATKFDRLLAKEGIEEDSPEYQRITSVLQNYREEQANAGHYFKRADAYAILKTKGNFKTSVKKKPVKKITVVKSNPHVGIQRNTEKNAKPKAKPNFKQLSLDEKEKALENVKF
jgi:hypothetical protein